MSSPYEPLLAETLDHALTFLRTLPDRPVGRPVDRAELRARLCEPLAVGGRDPSEVIADLVRDADPGLVASAGPRYFGFVTGGVLPAALAADWLTSTWDQNGALAALSPASAVIEEVTAGWLVDLLGLPTTSSVGFVSGCQMANFTGLAAGRHAVLARVGWNVIEHGLGGGPRLTVVIGADAHATIYTALRMLGIGRSQIVTVPADDQCRMQLDALAHALAAAEGPVLVAAQAGNVNTGAFDHLAEVARLTHARDGWLHVDGAFGLWAAAVPSLRRLALGIELADSWAVDGHKWLNVPYDAGYAIVRDAEAHRAAVSNTAAAYVVEGGAARDGQDWVPEMSRRSRAFATYAALRSLGRDGLVEQIERGCAVARRIAERLAAADGVRVLNEVVLNQVVVRFGDSDELTRAVIDGVQREGTCWVGPSKIRGDVVMRISVCGWSTSLADADTSADAILGVHRRRAAT